MVTRAYFVGDSNKCFIRNIVGGRMVSNTVIKYDHFSDEKSIAFLDQKG
jgi:hypothetical protein